MLGEQSKWCGAKKRDGSGTCHRPAGWGTPHPGIGRCKLHGGSTKSHVNAAYEQVLDQQVRKVLAELDVTPVDDPLSVLAGLLGQAVAFKDALAQRVNDLHELRYEDMKGAEQLRSEVVLWERALDRCEKFASSMAKLNIDDRLLAISERQADQVAGALNAALGGLGLSYEQQREAKRVLAERLRELDR